MKSVRATKIIHKHARGMVYRKVTWSDGRIEYECCAYNVDGSMDIDEKGNENWSLIDPSQIDGEEFAAIRNLFKVGMP